MTYCHENSRGSLRYLCPPRRGAASNGLNGRKRTFMHLSASEAHELLLPTQIETCPVRNDLSHHDAGIFTR